MNFRKFGLALLALPLLTACPGKKTDSTQPTAEAVDSPAAEAKEEPKKEVQVSLATPIEAVNGFYDAVAGEDYAVAWASLTKKSQDKFVDMVASDEKMGEDKIRALFENNEPSIRNGFWRSFRNSSKLDIYAPGATYKVVSESGDNAEVEMTSGSFSLKSKAFKEEGKWKLGYVETFLPEEAGK